ncbi:hypothetical protein AKJ09_07938 [Labilithrix luteola]|uniref:Uncharacterized protein n=1 Tax=Labilithrix luteola TaxID=1391654 RepID=A0A0K1Q7A6_9BACT|nr:hypothetical protein [Labilithrix luteola]AKV01275.1 hypothetical protein AKJ09_07938 [Labilithrix luteola]
MSARVDEALRLRALAHLGPFGDALARELLEQGSVYVDPDVLAWEGTKGPMHGHRVIVRVPTALYGRAAASHAAFDALSASLAAAMAERAGHSMADVVLEEGEPHPRGPRGPRGPYR